MALNIIQNKENPFFNRKEIVFNLESQSTPTFKEVEELVSKEFSIPTENVYVEKIKGNFGLRSFMIYVQIYSSKEEKEKLIHKNKKKKKEEVKK
jgi:ribosomal protein S24E